MSEAPVQRALERLAEELRLAQLLQEVLNERDEIP